VGNDVVISAAALATLWRFRRESVTTQTASPAVTSGR
jgi:hypothetical protein